MKRALFVAAVATTLAFAAVALGSVKHYRGPIEQGGHVTFDTKVKHHRAKQVDSFYFFKLKLTCEKAPSGASNTIKISNKSPIDFPIPPMDVEHRTFHGSFYKEEFKTRGEVEGEFTRRYRKAAGTLRVHGRPLGDAYGKCDSSTVDWTAEKQ
jgi:hypothetical protein